MYTKFMNSENSKTPEPHRLLLNLSDRIYLKKNDKYIALSNHKILVYTIHGKLQKVYKNNKVNSNTAGLFEDSFFMEGVNLNLFTYFRKTNLISIQLYTVFEQCIQSMTELQKMLT